MKKPKKLYLHIGTHKTGTTYLQSVLIQNRVNLLRQGFLFPRSGIESPTTHHCMLAARFLSEKDFRAFGVLTPLRLLLPPNKEFHWDKLMGEINQSPSHSIILSSENFSLINNLQPLKERLSGFNVKIIIHLRRQDKFYGSLRRKRLHNLAADLTNLRCDPFENPPKRLKVPVRAYHLLVHIDRAVNFDLDRVLSL